MTQYAKMGRLLKRRNGATAMELTQIAGTVSCHSRLSEMKRQGWVIVRKPIAGKNYGRYFGVAPDAKPA